VIELVTSVLLVTATAIYIQSIGELLVLMQNTLVPREPDTPAINTSTPHHSFRTLTLTLRRSTKKQNTVK
jgi:hypothetical protein